MDWKSVERSIYACRNEFDFVPPPEAPVFEPTIEEFSDPLGYINKIRPIAEKTGICKIKPPKYWSPPFSLDVDKLKFTPRIQKLNELEAVTRLKLNFLDKINRFWELQGHPLKIPSFEGKKIDLFSLYHIIKLEGGIAQCTANKGWRKVSSLLGYNHGPLSLSFLKNTYEHILLPFHEFCSEEKNIKTEEDKKLKLEVDIDKEKLSAVVAIDAVAIDAAAYNPCSRKYVKNSKTETESKEDLSRELKRLQTYGAGPKMPGCNVIPSITDDNLGKFRKRTKIEIDPLAIYHCAVCKNDNRDNELLVCNGCSETYHTFCLKPPLKSIPDGDWRCLSCIAEELKKPDEAFGFAQAERQYTLQEFGEMADTFKKDYFKMDSHCVSTVLAEREFWKIVSCTDADVMVEYGADLHSMDHGSGFPTKSSINLYPGDQEYVDSGWNLNNLPILNGSVLRFINTDISGMTVPWMYVGMCFSAFCWHNEDHWSYSINFLHWGEPKTWYGVPGSSAELLEKTMKSATPELFLSQPDLLHQLVTIMNPNILMDAGVPIYRTDQNAGEFVVTFPRSYHTGFNQGYNFAEAVNFAPPDWLPMGRECVLHYKSWKRLCVFSHDELICRMALDGDKLDLAVVIPAFKELSSMVEGEKRQRGMLADRGVKKAIRKAFEHLSDDDRQCVVCKTTFFLSALACETCPKMMVCLDHAADMCKCSSDNLVLLYRYNLDELHIMLETLKLRLQSFDKWMTAVKSILSATLSCRGRSDKLKQLVCEAEELKIPKCKLYQKLLDEHCKVSNYETVIIELDDDE